MNKKTRENDQQLPSVSLKDLLNEKGVISQYKDIDKPKKRFIPPTSSEVYDYCVYRGNDINPQKFIDYYTDRGWKVGNKVMKDWRLAIRTWESNKKTTILPSGYSEKLKHPKWQRKRLEVMQRDDFSCVVCTDNESTLHVHHIKYLTGLEPWEYDLDDLVTLCDSCHEIIEYLKKNYSSFYNSTYIDWHLSYMAKNPIKKG